jgi:hypothetical protein
MYKGEPYEEKSRNLKLKPSPVTQSKLCKEMGEEAGRTTQSPCIYSVYREQQTTIGGGNLWNKPNYISNLRHIMDEHFAEFIL